MACDDPENFFEFARETCDKHRMMDVKVQSANCLENMVENIDGNCQTDFRLFHKISLIFMWCY